MISAGAISGVEELAELLLNAVKLLKDAEQSSEGLELEQKLARIDKQLGAAMNRVDDLERQWAETRAAWIEARKAEGKPDFAA
jgi:hypothetical protein